MPASELAIPSLVAFIALVLASALAVIRRDHPRDPLRSAVDIAEIPNERVRRVVQALQGKIPHSVFERSDPAFLDSIKSYWSLQECFTIPGCIVKPCNREEVSTTIREIRHEHLRGGTEPFHFAVRSGGRAPDAGSANVQGGITIDLSLLKTVRIHDDADLVDIGPAARWGEVYEQLEKLGLGVGGGRVSSVGIAGLALGGGLSLFSPRMGLVCDNIMEYEIVLANGDIKQVTTSSECRDLWKTLKGGGNNFGIVTKFVARTFRQGKIWAGYNFHLLASTWPRLLEEFYKFSKPEVCDQFATTWLALGFRASVARIPGVSGIAMVTHTVYTKPEKDPSVLMPLKASWPLSTAKIQTPSDAGREMDSHTPPGQRALFRTVTFENDLNMLRHAYEIFRASTRDLKAITGLDWSFVFQTLHHTTTSKSQDSTSKQPDNVLGIDTDKTLIVVLISASWKLEGDDKTVEDAAKLRIAQLEYYAKEKKLWNRYKYMNYAGKEQDPIGSYGGKEKAFLQATSEKHDPTRLFQEVCVGGHKLF